VEACKWYAGANVGHDVFQPFAGGQLVGLPPADLSYPQIFRIASAFAAGSAFVVVVVEVV
jgi:hypothetical protein